MFTAFVPSYLTSKFDVKIKIKSPIILNIETLLEASTDAGLEINAERPMYTIMSRHPNSGQKQNIRIDDESFENVAKLKNLGTMLTNQNDIHDEIRSRLNSGNACYHSVQNILSSRLIKKTKD
jgi:hypothetical protein